MMGNSLTIGYVIGLIIYIGVIVWMTQTAKRSQTSDDFMAGGRREGVWSTLLGTSAAAYGSFIITSFVGFGYIYGWTGQWILFPGILSGWMFGVLLGPYVRRRMKKYASIAFTNSDFFVNMYDSEALRLPVCILSIFRDITVVGMEILGFSVLLQASVGLSKAVSIILISITVLVYTWKGGFVTVRKTMIFQGWLLLIATIIFGVAAFALAGSSFLPGSAAIGEIRSSIWNLSGEEWQWIMLTNFCYYWVWFVYWQGLYAAKDAKTVRLGYGLGQPFFAVLCYLMVTGGIALSAVYPNWDPFSAGPLFLNEMPQLFGGLGVIGAIIIFTSVAAAAQSTISGCLIAPVTVLGHDVIRMRMGVKDDKKVVEYSRWLIPIIILAGIGLAYSGQGILDLLYLGNLVVAAGLFWPIILSIFWKKANKTAALISSIACPIITLAIYLYGFYALKNQGSIGAFHAVSIGLIISLAIMVIGGLVSKEYSVVYKEQHQQEQALSS
jgi:Na+/proline symporter